MYLLTYYFNIAALLVLWVGKCMNIFRTNIRKSEVVELHAECAYSEMFFVYGI